MLMAIAVCFRVKCLMSNIGSVKGLWVEKMLYAKSHNCPYLEYSNHSSLEVGGYVVNVPLHQSATTLEQ